MSTLFGFPLWKIAYHLYSKKLRKTDTNKQYLEPLTTLFKLALVSFKDHGTKIAISNHRVYIQTPSLLQGTIRSVYGNTREEIHYLLQPILQCVKLYSPIQNTELAYLYRLAIQGLRKLKKSYDNDSSTVCYTIDLYISVLDRTLLSKSIYVDSYSTPQTQADDDIDQQLAAVDTEQGASSAAPIESIWRTIWTRDEIHLIYNLFQLTDHTSSTGDFNHNRQGYLSSIEDILHAKEELIDEKIHQANLWI